MMLLFLENHVPNIVFGCQKQPSQQHLGVALPAALLDPWLSCSVCTCHPELPKHMDSWYPTKLRWIIKNSEITNPSVFLAVWATEFETGTWNSSATENSAKNYLFNRGNEKKMWARQDVVRLILASKTQGHIICENASRCFERFSQAFYYIYLHQPSFEDNKLTNFDHENRYHIV